jgi:glycosyltransferase 2 family protein
VLLCDGNLCSQIVPARKIRRINSEPMQDLLYEEGTKLTTERAGRAIRTAAVLAAKLAVTAACFWYVSSKMTWAAAAEAAKVIDIPWAILAVALMTLQIPLVAIRWAEIVGVLAPVVNSCGRRRMLAITSISVFFGQVVPNLFGETLRVWMLARLGVDWRTGVASVLIDRAVGVFAIVALGFIAFLFPSPLTSLAGHRTGMLLILGAVLAIGVAGLVIARPIGAILVRHRLTVWLGRYAVIAHEVLVRSPARASVQVLALAVHVLMISAIWIIAHAEGLGLSGADAAALFTVIAGVAVIPLSIGGWGLREVGVTSLLQLQGIPVEQALVLSISFGVVTFLASMPGAITWLLYSPRRTAGTIATC